MGASQKEDSRGESNVVEHSMTTCSWVKARQTGAHQKVRREGKMGRYQNAAWKKKNNIKLTQYLGPSPGSWAVPHTVYRSDPWRVLGDSMVLRVQTPVSGM